MIPRYDPTYQYKDLFLALRYSLREGAEAVLCTQLKRIYGVKHVFIFANARTALFALLKAYNRPGGVLMPAYTCVVVPEAVNCAGYHPQFVDIDGCTLNMNRATLEKSLTPDCTVILATHTFGIPCDISEIRDFGRKNKLLIVEDAAPAVGAEYQAKPVGTFGDAAVISFQATKVISSEDGGALLTNNDELAEKVSHLLVNAAPPENHWFLFLRAIARKLVLKPKIYALALWAYRLLREETMYEVVPPKTENPETFLKRGSPFTSALVSTQLDKLVWNLTRRRRLAQIYREELAGNRQIILPLICEGSEPAWIQFPIVVKNKSHFYRYMQKHGIDMSWTYKYSCADSYGYDDYPETQAAARTVLGLPTYPSLTDDQAKYICSVVNHYVTED